MDDCLSKFAREIRCQAAGSILLLFLWVIPACPQVITGEQAHKSFSVADDIGLNHFASSIADPIIFSPDNRYFVVVSERGRIDLNRPDSSLRVYRTEDIQQFLLNQEITGEPLPLWTVSRATYKDGPIITNIRWLQDSSCVVFLAKTISGNDQLFLADIQAKTVQPLTPQDQHVTAFDIRSRSRFIYSVLSPAIWKKAQEDREATAIVGTGRTLDSLVFPEQTMTPNVWLHDLSELWADLDGRRFQVVDKLSGQPIPIHLEGQRALALSPNGHSLVTALTVDTIPPEWEALYPSSLPASPYRIRAGQQNPYGLHGQRDVSEYVLIDISSGATKPLTHAPIGNAAGWWGLSHADWSVDGGSVVLANTFIPKRTQDSTQRPDPPCVAVADLATGHVTCLERLKGDAQGNLAGSWRLIYGVHFARGDSRVVTVQDFGVDGSVSSTNFVRSINGSWSTNTTAPESASEDPLIRVFVKQGLNDPPVLMATDKKTNKSRIIWNPNPQLKDIQLGEVSAFKWKDKNGRDWIGGLYRPPDYVQGRRYPLILQTHGFVEGEFHPSGSSTTAFAAQELAAVGFLVLQLRDCPIRGIPEEGPCQVAGYEAAVERLSMDGLVDPNRIGIIGFSRTCYYVLETLTTSKLQFKAASITDGINHGYLQYILNIDGGNNSVAHEADAAIGLPPFGVGLQQWLKHSPEFNMDKVTAPLQVVATRGQILQMWEPYAALRYLSKPVDFLVLNSSEHVFTNPSIRKASQGGTVDWFRFWLQNYEEPNPLKSEQYKRWEALRALRDAAERATHNSR